jgi:hypothetical protein
MNNVEVSPNTNSGYLRFTATGADPYCKLGGTESDDTLVDITSD